MSWNIDIAHHQGGLDLAWTLRTEARFVGVHGASGLGKTTLLETLLGWRGRFGALAGAVGYLPQDVLLMPHWTVAEHFERLVPGPGGAPREVLFEALGIDALMARPARLLSGGEARRVGLARALLVAGGEGLLVLDEPFEALDRPRRVRVLGLLHELAARTRLRCILVSHRADELALLAEVVQRLEADGTSRRMGAPAPPNEALAREGVHENRIAATVCAVDGDVAICIVGDQGGAGGVEWVVPADGLESGTRAILGLRGDDVLLGLDDPGRVSARNKLEGRVTALRPAGAYVELDVALEGTGGAVSLSTHLTRGAVAELELKAGAPVRLFFKTRAVRLLALPVELDPTGSR